jgi:DNA repair protein RecO (recombination protein O)
MRPHDYEAIVLATMDYGESDRIVTFFTREQGKIRAIARHGKKSGKRFGAVLETFSRTGISVVVKGGLSSLRSAETVSVYPGIRANLEKIGYAGYVCEVIDRFLPEGLASPRLFRLLLTYLEYLDSFPPLADDRRFFEVNLLNILGYRLPVEQCGRCGSNFSPGTAIIRHTTAGELLCGACCRSGRPVAVGTLQLLAAALETGRFGVIRFGPESLTAAGAILDGAIAEHLTRPLNSLTFLRKVVGVCC